MARYIVYGEMKDGRHFKSDPTTSHEAAVSHAKALRSRPDVKKARVVDLTKVNR